MTKIIIPCNSNRAPTQQDYDELKREVNEALDQFYLHDCTMNMFIKNSMSAILKVYCYLQNKTQETSNEFYTNLDQEEQTLYSKLINLNNNEVRLDNYVKEHFVADVQTIMNFPSSKKLRPT